MFFATYMVGINDLTQGIKSWRIGHLLGISLLRQRYSRSKLGQFWLSISTGITILMFGLVWSQLFGNPIEEYLPYVAVAHVMYGLMTASFLDATSAVPANGALFENQETAFSTIVYSSIYRQTIIVFHNFSIIVLAWIYFQWDLSLEFFLFFPAVIMTIISVTLTSYIITLITTRFRDVAQIVNNVVQVAYFVTPVMWYPSMFPPEYDWVLKINPFSVFLATMRDPILGRDIIWDYWIIAGSITLVLCLITPWVIGKYTKRMIYWI
jgi:lipopolysaccharide transport system permease protein